jgi:hypothetical protein
MGVCLALCHGRSGILSLLGGLLMGQCGALASRLSGFTARLAARPNALPEFVAYVEVGRGGAAAGGTAGKHETRMHAWRGRCVVEAGVWFTG